MAASPVIVIIAIYAAWTGISMLLYAAGTLLSADGLLFSVLVESTVIFHLCLAALATAFFMVYAMKELRVRSGLRMWLIGLCLLLTGILYLSTRRISPDAVFLSQIAQVLNTANLLVFAALIGSWIAVYVKRPAELVPLGIVVMMADGFSVQQGPSREIIETLTTYYQSGMPGPPPAVDFLLMKIIVPGIGHPVPLFGVSDWIIIAFFSAVAAKFGMNDNLAGKSLSEMMAKQKPAFYFPVSALGLYIAVFSAHMLDTFLPALPFVVLFYLVYIIIRYPHMRDLSRFEWTATIGAIVLMTAVMILFARAAKLPF